MGNELFLNQLISFNEFIKSALFPAKIEFLKLLFVLIQRIGCNIIIINIEIASIEALIVTIY